MNKGQKYLSRAMVPAAVGVAALCWLAWRPCEPVAQASTTAPHVIVLPETTIVGEPEIPVVSVEDLPKVPQGSHKAMARISRKHTGECTKDTPGARCSWEDLQQGSGGVLFCDCR